MAGLYSLCSQWPWTSWGNELAGSTKDGPAQKGISEGNLYSHRKFSFNMERLRPIRDESKQGDGRHLRHSQPPLPFFFGALDSNIIDQGRKFIQERSPGYITARSAYTALENTIRGLSRTTIPRLPPAPGFEGDQEFVEQVELWERWIAWEKDDPLGMGNDDPKTLQQRILHVYKQALMALRFWPPLWADAADWCFENDIVKDGKEKGMEFLQEGIKANPESVLLALKFGERIEISYPVGDGEESKISKGKAVREPYDQLLNHLYGMVDAVKERESTEITKIENTDGADLIPIPSLPKGEDEEEDAEARSRAKEEQKKERISIVRKGFSVQTELLKKTITFVWVALFRAMRRIQGKGSTKAGAPYPGARGLFQEARSRGRLTSEIYAAVAQVEWNVYRDPSATKIFDRGSKLFPTDEIYLLEYLKHLHAQHDTTSTLLLSGNTATSDNANNFIRCSCCF